MVKPPSFSCIGDEQVMTTPHRRLMTAAAQPDTGEIMALMFPQENRDITDAAPQDRRRPNRLPFLRFITYGLTAPGDPESRYRARAAAINVSDGGLCLLLKEPISEADILRVDLPLADVATTSSTLAEVKWLKAVPWSTQEAPEYFVGVQFLL
jgi:hypothetical protein